MSSATIAMATTATAAVDDSRPKQLKQPSRKGKKAWRKNVDLMDVEEALADAVTLEMAGGKAHAKGDGELFSEDVAGSDKVRARVEKQHPKLRIDRILEERSAIRAVNGTTRTEETGVTKVLVQGALKLKVRHQSKTESAVVGKIVKRKLQEKESGVTFKKSKTTAVHPVADLWGDASEQVAAAPDTDFVTDVIAKKAPKAPATINKRLVDATAVPIVHPGASYRPTVRDHNALMDAETELEKKKRAYLARTLKGGRKIKMISYATTDDMIMVDRDSAEEQASDEGEAAIDDDDSDAIQSSKPAGPKSAKQRRAMAAQAAEQKVALGRREQRKLDTQAARAHDVANLITKIERGKERKAAVRKLVRAENLRKPRTRIGRVSVPSESSTVQLPEDLTDSFRRLKPEGNMLLDRYSSMTSRNLVEPRVVAKKRKNKFARKTFEKLSFRMFK